ncbi:hypothetical protein [Pelagovum pacificum]|uniref:Uncharacterized protein n=1 Tax=Pelagovum pacificum TaxID=2588711 RepID=A0A5C5GBZ5_9RHOB|nr:hypothetical protein [Pelagovum pacificum]QQA42543.1 hypothetical protein I8N54_17420 [Pelagovum pacificum]TNY31627.1 hypothetical protein FHY64_16615 [Pelagovum pacificum]
MRDFFINAFEKLVGVLVILMIIGVVLATAGAATGMYSQMPGAPSPIIAAIMVFVGGSLYVILFAGLMYLGLGIYQNTRRTAEALAKGPL